MARKGWSSLSSDYRSRLERGGVSRSDYERGESLSTARGHGSTPERPELAESKPEYEGYRNLRNEIIDLKRELWGGTGRFSEKNSRKEMRGMSHSKLEKARDVLGEMSTRHLSWDEMRTMYPELEDDDYDWIGHYH